MFESTNKLKKSDTMSSRKKQRLFFYTLMMILPMAQVLLFYFYVNINSFLMAFQSMDYDVGGYVFTGLGNFVEAFNNVNLGHYFGNSLLTFVVEFFTGTLGSVFFSYYIYKKKLGHGFFKIMLYMPHIISTTVFVILYKFFVENAIPSLYLQFVGVEIEGLLANPKTTKLFLLIFCSLNGFGAAVLMYSSAMSSISESVIESAELDGVSPMKELIFIVLPSVWSTFVTFVLVRVVGIFTNQMNLYTFYESFAEPHLSTIGYWMYCGAVSGKLEVYPMYSAMGMSLTAIAVPITLILRRLLNKFGPSVD
ncbi:MAG: sugar ABC transporter permease [Clostridia bacterium]|nr:sugar ABC transporter permease [Clostridia bacterium]